MCSISGVIQLNRSDTGNDKLSSAVNRMNKALRHRGPDDQGFVEIPIRAQNSQIDLCLGNTRLAIIDTTIAGHQPMRDAETGNLITYNGETYNHRELRAEIGDEFGPWNSNTDTEVVLRAYRKWGVQSFAKLRGMFALAIWDQSKRQLVLARDRFGIKPLYCYFGPWSRNAAEPFPTIAGNSGSIASGKFLFASEVRALLASNYVPRILSDRGVSSFLEYGSVQSPLTIIEDVWSVMPGTALTVSGNDFSELSFVVSDFDIKLQEISQPVARSRSEAKSELRTILEDSIKAHLVSDVPLGVFLSGGMDSSAIVGLMSKVASEQPKTFSVVFEENNFSEATHSRAVAERFRTKHHEIKLSEESLLNLLPDALAALDQPSMDGINSFTVSKAAKDAGVTVALSGLGGDELFGGYPSFRRALRLSSTGAVTRGVMTSLAWTKFLLGSCSARRSKFAQLATSNGDPHIVYQVSRQLFPPDSIRGLARVDINDDFQVREVNNNGENDTINLISRLELNGYMANTLLRDTDSMSMAHSLEVRVPFVDMYVTDYVLAMPGSWKVDRNLNRGSKPLLAELISDLFPPGFFARPKMGFTLPFEKWMTLQLREEISSVLHEESQLAAAGIDPSQVAGVWSRFLRKPKAVGWSRPWSLYVLVKWCSANEVTTARLK